MITQILVPKLGFAMEQGTIAEWLVADGAIVTAGAPLYSLESDKSVEEIPAPAAGRLRIIEAAGTAHKVGAVIGELDDSAPA